MSHITTIRTEFYDREVLLETLRGLNLTVQEGGRIQGFGGSGKTMDLIVGDKGGARWGFQKDNAKGAYQIEGIWEELNRREVKGLISQIHQGYAQRKVIKEARVRGFSLVNQVRTETGAIKLTLRKVAGF